jgi:hypothetical protein
MGLSDQSTDASKVGVGNDAQRPQSPQAGTIRHNTDAEALETYDGTQWVLVSQQPDGRVLSGDSVDQAAPSAQYLIDNNAQTTNGFYWIEDESGQNPARQVYCDLQGTEAGSGYMRIDSTWASYYGGDGCNSGTGQIDSNGTLTVSCNTGGPSEYQASTPGSGEIDLGEYDNRVMHFGVGGYYGGFNRPCAAKFWFK